MDTTRKLANFITETSYPQIPQEATSIAKDAILDLIGVTLAGVKTPTSRIMAEYVREMGGNPVSRVIGWGFKTSPHFAALANGTTGHALDYDDGAPLFLFHPTVTLLPSILALGEAREVSGKQVLEAYLIGFEVEVKLLSSLGLSAQLRGWHNTGIVGALGAAVAAAKILLLNSEQTVRALGIAASEASGMKQNFGTMTKPLHAGLASRNGVMAAMLAEKGFTASETVLEHPTGYYAALAGEGNYDLKKIESLGNPFSITEPPGVLRLKPYPSCGETHCCLDAVLYLIKEHNISAEDVAEVECRTSEVVPMMLIYSRPQSGLQAKFSMEYCMAVALLDGRAGLAQFTEERLQDARLQPLMEKVKYALPEDIRGVEGLVNYDTEDGKETITEAVTVRLRDGREYFKESPRTQGVPGSPMSRDDLLAKYRECASLALPLENIERTIELISALENLDNITELLDLVNSTR